MFSHTRIQQGILFVLLIIKPPCHFDGVKPDIAGIDNWSNHPYLYVIISVSPR